MAQLPRDAGRLEIIDAEWEEVGDAESARAPTRKSTAGRAAKNVVVALGAIVVGMTIIGLVAGSPSNSRQVVTPRQTNTERDSQPKRLTLTGDWLAGSWLLVPRGGEDGKTRCADFNIPAIYRLNGQTAKIVSFGVDGRYRSLFSYSTPGGDEHYQVEKSQWRVRERRLELLGVSIEAPFGGDAGDVAVKTAITGPNTLKLDEERFVRCEGDTSDFFGDQG